jgi:hypothetical protein
MGGHGSFVAATVTVHTGTMADQINFGSQSGLNFMTTGMVSGLQRSCFDHRSAKGRD